MTKSRETCPNCGRILTDSGHVCSLASSAPAQLSAACPSCGSLIPYGTPHVCLTPYGWVCPRCGRGNAPSTPTCPCIPVQEEWQW